MTPAEEAAVRTLIAMLTRLLPDSLDNHEGGSADNCYGCVQDMVEATGREVCPKSAPAPVCPNTKHRGENAEDCQACCGKVNDLPYPWICPGPE